MESYPLDRQGSPILEILYVGVETTFCSLDLKLLFPVDSHEA